MKVNHKLSSLPGLKGINKYGSLHDARNMQRGNVQQPMGTEIYS